MSGHGKKATKRGVLTNWRPQRKGLVRMQRESDQMKGTHSLEAGPHREELVRAQKESGLERGTYPLESA